MKTFCYSLIVFFISLGSSFCLGNPSDATAETTDLNADSIRFTATPADDWNAVLTRTSGWLAADGVYSMNLSSGKETPAGSRDRILFIFSDSFLGEIKDGKLQPGCTMVNNTVALLEGKTPDPDKITFYWRKPGNKTQSVFLPEKPKDGSYFWLGDGFVNTDNFGELCLFAYEMRNTGKGAFGFEQIGTSILTVDKGEKMPFNRYRQTELPFSFKEKADKMTNPFGAGIFMNTEKAGAKNPDGYVYIYGVYGEKKQVLVARVLPKEFTQFSAWRFWNGSEWDSDVNHAAAVTDRASHELSLTQLSDGRYALIFQIDTIGAQIGMRLAKQPQGPFGPIIKVWDCPEVKVSPNFYVYNAKAHPVLSSANELIISYNVNSFKFLQDINSYPNYFRPRFVRVTFE